MKPISDEELEKLIEQFNKEPRFITHNTPVYLVDEYGNLKRVRWSPLHWRLHNWWTKIKKFPKRGVK